MLDQKTAFATSGSTRSSTYTSAQFGPNPFSSLSSAGGNEYGYTGRRHDCEGTGLMYFRARYYSGELGRFVTRDPLSADVNGVLQNYLFQIFSDLMWRAPAINYFDGMSMYRAYFVVDGLDPSGLSVAECMARCQNTDPRSRKGCMSHCESKNKHDLTPKDILEAIWIGVGTQITMAELQGFISSDLACVALLSMIKKKLLKEGCYGNVKGCKKK